MVHFGSEFNSPISAKMALLARLAHSIWTLVVSFTRDCKETLSCALDHSTRLYNLFFQVLQASNTF